jgi:beta-galactosidase beta subunit
MTRSSRDGILPILILGALFFLFGFVTWVNGPLISYLKIICELEPGAEPFYVTFAFYIAYFLTALPQGYDTKDPATCLFEAHRRYLDIQYVIDGAEAMGWAPLDGLVVTDPYDAARDIAFYRQPSHWVNVPVRVGQFTIFYPEDGHMPGLRMEGITRVRKVVMKVLVG